MPEIAAIPPHRLRDVSSGALASVGDSVYDLLVRTELVTRGTLRMGDLHRARVAFVNAKAQARAAALLAPLFTEEEAAVFRRGRNAELPRVPPAATRAEYHQATALEALFGWLYLSGDEARIGALFAVLRDHWDDIPHPQASRGAG